LKRALIIPERRKIEVKQTLLIQELKKIKATKNFKKLTGLLTGGSGRFFGFLFYVIYSTLLHLPPLRFYCVQGCC
jgi:hypothetical protein